MLWASNKLRTSHVSAKLLQYLPQTGWLFDFTFPDAADSPSTAPQPAKVSLIARTIGAQFLTPKVSQLVFPRWEPPAVPEIRIDKNGHAMLRENDVRTSR